MMIGFRTYSAKNIFPSADIFHDLMIRFAVYSANLVGNVSGSSEVVLVDRKK